MNKIKTYREYIILIAIAAVLLLYIIFRSAGNINYNLPEPAAVDQNYINRITIKGADTDLEFSKTDEQWFIEPDDWQADNSNLTAITKALAGLKITDLISTSGNPEVYSLDEENRIIVKAYNRDELLREIYVGKVSSTGIYTYMMFPGDDNIYSVRGNLPSRVKDKNSMRDKKFMQLQRDTVLKMTLKAAGAAPIVLFRDPEGIWRGEGFEADDAAVKSAVNMLDPLRCKDFIYKFPRIIPEWTIEFLTEEGTYSLDIWPETEKGVYPARSSQNGYMVQTTSYAAEKLLGAFGIMFEDEE